MLSLFRRHHRAVHEEGVPSHAGCGRKRGIRSAGRPSAAEGAGAAGLDGRPLAPVGAQLEREGIELDPDTLTSDWRGERLALDWVIHQLWRPRPRAEATCQRRAADES